jgi:hypothetical protein
VGESKDSPLKGKSIAVHFSERQKKHKQVGFSHIKNRQLISITMQKDVAKAG